MKKILTYLFVFISLFTFTSCEGMEGFDLGQLEELLGSLNGDLNDPNADSTIGNIILETNGLGTLDITTYENVSKIPSDLPVPIPNEGYEFDGWFYDRSLMSPVNVNDPVNGDVVLYAKFAKKIYTVRFVHNGEVVFSSQVKHGTSITSYPTVEVSEGYVHVGWGIDGVIFNGEVTSDLTLEAIVTIPNVLSIEEFKEKQDPENHYFIKGVVTTYPTTANNGSFMLSDETGHIFVYAKSRVEIGDEILMYALYQDYYDVPEVKSYKYLEVLSKNNDYMQYCQEIVEYNVADMEVDIDNGLTRKQIVDKYYNKYLKISGIFIENGSQYRLVSNSESTYYVQVFSSQLLSSADYSLYLGKVVDIYGFLRGTNLNNRTIILQIQNIILQGQLEEEIDVEVQCDKIAENLNIGDLSYDHSYTFNTTSPYLPGCILTYNIVGYSTTSKLENNVLIVSASGLNNPENVTVEISISYNGNTYLRYLEYTVYPESYVSVSEFIEKSDENNSYLIKGIIINTDGTNAHVLADGTGIIFCYFKANVNIGDEVIINAVYMNYYGAHEVAPSSTLIDIISRGNDVSVYVPDTIDVNIHDIYNSFFEEDFDSYTYGDMMSGKYIHIKGYFNGSAYLLDNNGNSIVRLYPSLSAQLVCSKGDVVEVWGYCRAVYESRKSINFQTVKIEIIKSDAMEIDLQQFHGAPEEYMDGKKVKFEGIVTEKVEDGLFVVTQVVKKKEYTVLVEGDYKIGDKYCFIGSIQHTGKGYKLINKQIPDDEISADIITHLVSEQYIILDSNATYEEHYANSLYTDGVITNCVLEEGKLTFYLETSPYIAPESTVVLIVTVDIEDLVIDPTIFIGKTISGRFYKDDIDDVVSFLSLDLSMIIIR